ncbi:hypothetical protein NDI47_09575 [Microcoleus vaginatus GB1-A2]|uniref:hypothetical protein n=1 Tax=Microcoleus vaginatus TaxID=119532 RepID=UPI00168882CD|nr:hypothetical protein [Microcoleus sp. FACHB-61]
MESGVSRAFHPTLTFDRYSVGFPVWLAKLLGVTVAIGLLLVYLQFYWGIDLAYLWQTVKQLPEAFNFSIGA